VECPDAARRHQALARSQSDAWSASQHPRRRVRYYALVATTGRVAAGVIALAAAAFGATLTTVNASHRMNQAAAAGNAYLEIQTAARQMRELDLPYMDLEEARTMVGEITARRDEQNKTAEPPSKRLYRRARKNLESGGQDYAADAGKEEVRSQWL